MHCIMFSKLLKELDISGLIEALRKMGADGVDLCVRDGYPVNPANARTELAKAVKQIRSAGLSVPMVTAPTTMSRPDDPAVESIFTACHDADVPCVKIGYWTYRDADYWKLVDAARRDVASFEAVATRLGVKACLHTHSGNYLGLNVSSLMHLVRGSNPAHIGVYIDPGHLALCGEPLPMCFDMAGEHLSLIAVKDSLWERGTEGRARRSRFLPVGEGMVDWRTLVAQMAARRYAGPLSFHSEYEGLATPALLEQTRKDMAFVRALGSDSKR